MNLDEIRQQLTQIQNSGDANNLVLFLSQYSYHTEGLQCDKDIEIEIRQDY